MVYRDASDGKLKIKYGDLWKVLATIAIVIITLITYKSNVDSNLSRLDYLKADKDAVSKIEQTISRMDEKLNFIYDYMKEQKERNK